MEIKLNVMNVTHQHKSNNMVFYPMAISKASCYSKYERVF